MRKMIDGVSGFILFIILEIIVSILAFIFIVPILDSESIWSFIVVGLIIFVNSFVFLGILLVSYFKQVKSGLATSIVVKICVIFLILVFIGISVMLFLSLIM